MKKLISFLSAFAVVLGVIAFILHFSSFTEKKSALIASDIKEGDIVFQTTSSKQCTAVQMATHSVYSHCGIVLKKGNKLMVYEAVQPVKYTPLNEFVLKGNSQKYVVRRLKNADSVLTEPVLDKMRKQADKYFNKNYDIYFGWSDDLIYCSELVWKIYKNGAGVEVGELKKLKDFDLSSSEVKKIMKERYGKNIPYEEIVVAPSDIFESDNLIAVIP